MARRRATALPAVAARVALLILLALSAAQPSVSAANDCNQIDSSQQPQQPFTASFHSGPFVTTSAVRRSTRSITQRRYCLTLKGLQQQQQQQPPAPCTSPCCSHANTSRLARVHVAVDSECLRGDAASAKRATAVKWQLDGADVASTFLRGSGEFRVSMPRGGWAGGEGQLCMLTSSDSGLPNPCPTLGQLCGEDGCSVRLEHTVAVPPPTGSRSKKSTTACCWAQSDVSLTCPSGQGIADPAAGIRSCAACRPGTFAEAGALPTCRVCETGSIAPVPGSTACTACGSGEAPNANKTACVLRCEAGTGGTNCDQCPRGTFSAGGVEGDATPDCQSCPSRFTTAEAGATKQEDCTIRTCGPGTGGFGCVPCEFGTFSTGGTGDEPFRACQSCPTGSFTTRTGARSESECTGKAARSCDPGFASVDGACHVCPQGTYSPGGLTPECERCPGLATTRAPGATGPASCYVPTGVNVTGATFWSTSPSNAFSQACRQDLAAFFSSAEWDGWRADRLRTLPEGCRATVGGMAEIILCWHARVFEGKADEAFRPSAPGDLPVEWRSIGAADYVTIFGYCPRNGVPAWTAAEDLESLFFDAGDGCVAGRVLTFVKQLQPDRRPKYLSIVNAALAEREASAYQALDGRLDADAAYAWLVLRKLKDSIELLIPGLRPETPRTDNGSLVELDSSALSELSGRRRLHASAPPGLMVAPMTDDTGRPLNLVCGAGIRPDGSMASRMAIDGWDYGKVCQNWPPLDDTSRVTETRYLDYSSDESMALAFALSIEVQIPVFFGISVSLGLGFAVSSFEANDKVAISCLVSKREAVPTYLPSQVPTLTSSALALLRTQGPEAFQQAYGSHFVVGFQRGGSLLMSYSLQSNQLASKAAISASLGIGIAFVSVSAGGGFSESRASKQVNIVKSVRTNNVLPPNECARVGVGDAWTSQDAERCAIAWSRLPGNAAYAAYAVPYAAHPEYQRVLLERGGGSGRRRARMLLEESLDAVPVPDDKFKNTGLLLLRLNALASSLDKYRFKEDAFFRDAQRALEAARDETNAVLALLRSKTFTSVEEWRPRYLKALGLVNAASAAATYVPKASRCGWCTQLSLEERGGGCNTTCTSTQSCTVACNGAAPKQCANYGFAYTSTVSASGQWSPQCRASVTGPVCVKFGTAGVDNTGGYHCSKVVCDWQSEYCDDDVERDSDGEWACMGSCRPRTAEPDKYDTCSCSPPSGSQIVPDFSTSQFCFFGDAAVDSMWTPPPGQGSGGVWSSMAAFRASFPTVSLYASPANNGYKAATTSFLRTNCPVMRPIRIQAPDPSRGGALSPQSFYLNSCGCRKDGDMWIKLPGPRTGSSSGR